MSVVMYHLKGTVSFFDAEEIQNELPLQKKLKIYMYV